MLSRHCLPKLEHCFLSLLHLTPPSELLSDCQGPACMHFCNHATWLLFNSSNHDQQTCSLCISLLSAFRSQQKAAGRTSSPTRQPGAASRTEGPRSSAPVPPTQLASSDPSPHRASVPDDFAQSEPHAGPLAHVQTAEPPSPTVDMQQLQSNLLRPATPPAARLQAAAEGQNEEQGGQSAYV